VAPETATRSLDALSVGPGITLLINGAAGGIGSTAVQLAVARGARVIGTASTANHDYLGLLGAEPVTYGEGMAERVRTLAPDGVDAALDVAGSGVLPDDTAPLLPAPRPRQGPNSPQTTADARPGRVTPGASTVRGYFSAAPPGVRP
jgi:NADPH:quinone reductase-like Zn-dependent oxidoreductase